MEQSRQRSWHSPKEDQSLPKKPIDKHQETSQKTGPRSLPTGSNTQTNSSTISTLLSSQGSSAHHNTAFQPRPGAVPTRTCDADPIGGRRSVLVSTRSRRSGVAYLGAGRPALSLASRRSLATDGTLAPRRGRPSNRFRVTPLTAAARRWRPFPVASERAGHTSRTPAKLFFPRRRTSHSPATTSASPGRCSGSDTRSLLR
jgi:hypothetical protein